MKSEKTTTWVLPEGINNIAWEEFEEHRSLMPKRYRLTDLARTKAAKKLLKLSTNQEEQQDIVDQTIERGYTGLFPTDEMKRPGGWNGKHSRQDNKAEQNLGNKYKHLN
ncbi:hypothetical protein KAR91_52585 [Candidatus Pacearchaeota archaeon]|nr:hypothetical protein [Candidatus Pacearchaeota archaeon]